MLFVTVANKVQGYFPVLQQSFARHGLHLEVLGGGEPWGGFAWKLAKMYEFVRAAPPGEIVVFMDAFDVVLVSPVDLEARFRAFARNIVFSRDETENVDWVVKHCKERIFKPAFEHTINSGLYMGYAAALGGLFAHISALRDLSSPAVDDQEIVNVLPAESPDVMRFYQENVAIDADSRIFLTVMSPHYVGWYDPRQVAGTRALLEGRLTPNFLHGPGKCDLSPVIERLGYDSSRVKRPGPWEYSMWGIKSYGKYLVPEILALLALLVVGGYLALRQLQNIRNNTSINKCDTANTKC